MCNNSRTHSFKTPIRKFRGKNLSSVEGANFLEHVTLKCRHPPLFAMLHSSADLDTMYNSIYFVNNSSVLKGSFRSQCLSRHCIPVWFTCSCTADFLPGYFLVLHSCGFSLKHIQPWELTRPSVSQNLNRPQIIPIINTIIIKGFAMLSVK